MAASEYSSEFEYDSEAERKRARRNDLAVPAKKAKVKIASSQNEVLEAYDKEERIIRRHHYLSLDAYSRHRLMVNNYLMYYGGSMKDFEQRDSSRDKRDIDIIREEHQFLWDDEEIDEHDTWEQRLAKKYYQKLFKEYCICDLTRYKENKVAMRWRVEKEVVEGKGQFTCGNKHCKKKEALKSWEVNFGYVEHREKKNALVKLRLCPDCSYKLNYRHKRKEWKKRSKSKASREQEATEPVPEVQVTVKQEVEVAADVPSTSAASASDSSDPKQLEKEIWSAPVKKQEEKSRDEEFEEYFDDMFM